MQTTALESTPKAAIFVSSRSWGTKSKPFLEKSIIMASVRPQLYSEPVVYWQTIIS
jgi:hypothetical protein